jgi:hypothetical protein
MIAELYINTVLTENMHKTKLKPLEQKTQKVITLPYHLL